MLIGDVSRRCGVSARMLRHYDALGLVQPTGRTSGGYREYSPEDVRRLFHVECLRTLGLSLGEAKRALDEPEFAPADLVAELIAQTRGRIADEQDLLTRLERVQAAEPMGWTDATDIVALLRALESDDGARRQQAILTQAESAALPAQALVDAVLAEEDLNVAGALRWSLARAGSGLAELAVGLGSSDVLVRRRALLAIAEATGPEATNLLWAAQADPDVMVRDRATLALGRRGVAEMIPALVEMVISGDSDVEAAETLGLLADSTGSAQSIASSLQEEFRRSSDPAVRSRLTQSLAEVPGAPARRALEQLTGDADPLIAATAAAILRH